MRDGRIDLADELRRFIQLEIAEGRFASPSEVIEAGLLLLKERENRLAALRSMIAEGERPSASPPTAPQPRLSGPSRRLAELGVR